MIIRLSRHTLKLLAAALLLQWLCIGSLFCSGNGCGPGAAACSGAHDSGAVNSGVPYSDAHCSDSRCHAPPTLNLEGAGIDPGSRLIPVRGHGRSACCKSNRWGTHRSAAGNLPEQVRVKLFALLSSGGSPGGPALCACAKPKTAKGLLPSPSLFLLNQSFLC